MCWTNEIVKRPLEKPTLAIALQPAAGEAKLFWRFRCGFGALSEPFLGLMNIYCRCKRKLHYGESCLCHYRADGICELCTKH